MVFESSAGHGIFFTRAYYSYMCKYIYICIGVIILGSAYIYIYVYFSRYGRMIYALFTFVVFYLRRFFYYSNAIAIYATKRIIWSHVQ